MKKRVLSSIGVGGATVDTVLPDGAFSPGEAIEAAVELEGGDTEQTISRIYFTLRARGTGGAEFVLSRFAVEDGVVLGAAETRSIPVTVHLPAWTPLTRTGASVWLETGLDISWAVDPSDEDELEVVPDDRTAALFEAIDDLGFTLADAELLEVEFVEDRPIAQKFDFRPRDADAALDDIEVTLLPRRDDLRVLIEFGRVDEVEAEYDVSFDEDEVSLTFEHANAEMMARRIRSEIRTHT